MSSLLSLTRDGYTEHGNQKKDSVLYQKIADAENRFTRCINDAIEETPVIINPHGLNPKVKRLVLRRECLTLFGFKTGRLKKQWALEDILKVKRHTFNFSCFTIVYMERRKRNKVKNQKYSFEVKGELECWHWIEVLNEAIANSIKEKNRAETTRNNTLSPTNLATRSRSTSAPPTVELNKDVPKVKVSDDSDDNDPDSLADQYDDDDDDDDNDVATQKKGAEPQRRSTIHSSKSKSDTWKRVTADVQQKPMASSGSFNPFWTSSLQQTNSEPICSSNSFSSLQTSNPQVPLRTSLQTSSNIPIYNYPLRSQLPSGSDSVILSPPTSQHGCQGQNASEPSVHNAPQVYITTMSPPTHMRIIQDLGLISATGTAGSPQSAAQCGQQVETALQAAKLELSHRAASRGANAVFQTLFSIAFNQFGVTVLVCGTACTAAMVAM